MAFTVRLSCCQLEREFPVGLHIGSGRVRVEGYCPSCGNLDPYGYVVRCTCPVCGIEHDLPDPYTLNERFEKNNFDVYECDSCFDNRAG